MKKQIKTESQRNYTHIITLFQEENINKTIIASSKTGAQDIFKNEFMNSIERDNDHNYKKNQLTYMIQTIFKQ